MKNLIKKLLPNSILISYRFKSVFNKLPNLLHPKKFNEKIAHRMLNPKKIYSKLSDKIAVREYVSKKIGDKYLIPILWQGKSLSEIDFEMLPNSFVIKANHASGTNLIVRDKSKINYINIKKLTDSWLDIDFHAVNLEKHYKDIDRSLLAEELLLSDSESIPSDYKVHVFNSKSGSRFFIQVDYDRFDDVSGHKRDIYDADWNFIPMEIQHKNSNYKEERPLLLEEMLSESKKLSSEFAYSRIDWYICNGKIYFGEITFTHGCALEQFNPPSKDAEWGKLWDMNYEK